MLFLLDKLQQKLVIYLKVTLRVRHGKNLDLVLLLIKSLRSISRQKFVNKSNRTVPENFNGFIKATTNMPEKPEWLSFHFLFSHLSPTSLLSI